MFQYDEPFGHTIFCDDIRYEIGNKNSYIGVYSGNMQVPVFPATVPKFGIVVTLYEPREMAERRNWDITLSVYLPGDDPSRPTMTGPLPPVPPNAFRAMDASKLPPDPDVPRLVILAVGFVLAPMILRSPGRIKVRATYREGAILKLGSLKVELLTPSDPNLFAST